MRHTLAAMLLFALPFQDVPPREAGPFRTGYDGGTAQARAGRDLLRAAMEREGFAVESNEWWHFNYKDWTAYPILDIPFAEIGPHVSR